MRPGHRQVPRSDAGIHGFFTVADRAPTGEPYSPTDWLRFGANCLNLDLAGDLDEVFGRQVEAVDGVDRVAEQKGEERELPAREVMLLRVADHPVGRGDIDRLGEIGGAPARLRAF